MLLQLNPPIPLSCPKGKGLAHLVRDPGPESHLEWTLIVNEGPHAGEVWTFPNPQVRGLANETLARQLAPPLTAADVAAATDARHDDAIARALFKSHAGRCTCSVADRCPLGKTGLRERCTVSELNAQVPPVRDYPKGARVRNVGDGTTGTVDGTRDDCEVIVKWDNGMRTPIVPQYLEPAP